MLNRVSTMSTTCTECDREFSRKDAMLRHKRNKHGTTHTYTCLTPSTAQTKMTKYICSVAIYIFQ
jgi:uncharacterized Zn-finger protein